MLEFLFKNVAVLKALLVTYYLLLFICERLLFEFFNGSLFHRPKGLRPRLYDGARSQGLTVN